MVEKTECYRVATIQFLKTFCSGIVAPSETKGLTYCPTFKELTGGTIIQNWEAGTTPNLDKNGIVVNKNAVLGGTYADNQCVDQSDISVRYTEYNGITVSANPTAVTACAGTSSLSYSKSWTRYTKYMKTCSESSYTTGTTSTAVTDTTSAGVTWSVSPSTAGSVTNNTLSYNKNGTVSSSARDITVTGTYNGKSDSVTIRQAGLSGTYDNNLHHRASNSFAITSTKPDRFNDCNAGTIPYTATLNYTEYYEWVDSCNKHYSPSEKAYSAVSKSNSSSSSLSYIAVEPDCEVDQVATKTASSSTTLNTITGGTITLNASKTFTIVCPADPSQAKCASGCSQFIVNGGDETVAASGGGLCDSIFIGPDITDYTIIYEENGVPKTSCSWITSNIYIWNHTWQDWQKTQYMCSWYDYYPCVAQSLMIDAEVPGAGTYRECNPGGAYTDPALYPQVVQDAINNTGTYGQSLAAVKHTIAANPNTTSRSCKITFVVDSMECPSKTFYVTQLGSSSSDCKFKVTALSSCISSGGGYTTIATYSTTGTCTGSVEIISKPSWVNDNITLSSGSIYATVQSNNGSKRSGYVEIKYNDIAARFYVEQCAGTAPVSCSVSGGYVPGYPISGNIQVGTYYNCSGTLTATYSSGNNFLTNFTFSGGKIMASVSSWSNCFSQRTGTYTIKNGSTTVGTITVTQESVAKSVKINGMPASSAVITFNANGTLNGNYYYEPSIVNGLPVSLTFDNLPSWVTLLSGVNGSIIGNAQTNSTGNVREDEDAEVQFGSSDPCPGRTFTVRQKA